MNVLKDWLYFRMGHLYIQLPLKLFFVSWQCFHNFLNKFENAFYLVCLLVSIYNGDRSQVFFVSIWLLLLLWILFCGDSFDDGAGNICLCTGIICWGGVTWCSFKEATSFFNRFISYSKFCPVFCVLSFSSFDVAEAAGLCLFWSRLFFLFIRSFWATDVLLWVSVIFCFLSFLWMLVLFFYRGWLHRLVIPQSYMLIYFLVKLQSMFKSMFK